jgi:tetratricopeptide (TPR) repeat protein/predicted Ser/Thr protein kinase
VSDAHAQLAEFFARLIELDGGARDALLRECDADTRARLERLLAADARDDDPIERSISYEASALAQTAAHGARFGPWRALRELGAGGMGSVLLAERADGQFEQQVAIKLIRGFPTEDGQRRLRQERQILAQLDHPYIAHLLDGGEAEDGQPYVVMEYVDGVPLLEYVALRALDLRARLELFDKVASAVQHAHERLVIHRDLKPGNVLVREDGEPRLLDFGVAKLVDLSAASDPRQTSTRVWTPGYASPEQQSGGAVTTASDVYALGIVLREMLSGERAAGQGGVPAGFAPLPIGAELRGILAKATEAKPAQRYATVEALRADLQRWRDGRPVRAAPDTAAYRLRKFIGRHRLGTALALLALLAVGAFVWQLARERERALAAEARATAAQHAAERDAATARSALAFLTDSLNAAMPEQSMRAEVSVRDLLDHARAELEKRSEPRLRQPVQRMLGHLYASLGEPRISAQLLAEGLAGVEAHERGEAVALANDYDGYGTALGALEQGADSLAAAQRGAALRQRFAPDDEEQSLRSLDQLGFGYYRIQEYDRAEKYWTRSIALAARLPQPPLDIVTNSYQGLASILIFRGEPQRALVQAEAGLAFVDRHLSADSPLRVNLMRARGEALASLGRGPEAETALREAIALQERSVGTRGIRLGSLYNALALVLNDLGRYREAIEALEKSHALESVAGGAPMEDAIGLSNIAAVLESAGDYPKALAMFERAVAATERSESDPDTLARRMLERNYARTLGLAGQRARAQERLSHLRQRARELDGEDSAEYAMTTWQLMVLAKYQRDPRRGVPLLQEARMRFAALLPGDHPIFAHARRAQATFALLQGDLATAEREQRAALAAFEAAAVLPVDLAIAQAELAEIRARRGARGEARTLLDQALPVLRERLLPAEVCRAAAEALDRSLPAAVTRR